MSAVNGEGRGLVPPLSDDEFVCRAFGDRDLAHHEISGPRGASISERAFFTALVSAGLRPDRNFTILSRHLPRRPNCAFGTSLPDAVFRTERVAVYYDGCYWHECPIHFPGARRGDIAARDARAGTGLRADGWTVIRGWEHEPVEDLVDRVVLSMAYLAVSECAA